MNKQLLKTSGTDVLSSRKRFRKKLWGLASFPPPALYVRRLIFNHSYLYPSKVPVSVPFGFPAVSVWRGVYSVRHFSTSCCYLLIILVCLLFLPCLGEVVRIFFPPIIHEIVRHFVLLRYPAFRYPPFLSLFLQLTSIVVISGKSSKYGQPFWKSNV